MTAKMTDEQKIALANEYAEIVRDSYPVNELEKRYVREDFVTGLNKAESIYLPQNEQLQGVNESLHATLEKYVKEHATMQGEIERLKELLRQHEGISEALTQCTFENTTLTAKHDALVKGLKEIPLHGEDPSVASSIDIQKLLEDVKDV